MSIVKSLSVGDGDMFYINHNSSNFTIIDCHIEGLFNRIRILNEIDSEANGKDITRFISTHPDEDHFKGLEYLDKRISIKNFYCVQNKTTKEDETDDFKKYCELRDDSQKAFYIYKGCERQWMNKDGNDSNGKHIGSSGINILWPDTNNKYYKEALQIAKDGGSPNNISAVIKYSLQGGATILWMGDLETAFMENIQDSLILPKVNILFAPHHGRDSGTVPSKLLEAMDPDIIIIGEADSEHINYYDGYNTITQNTAGDITLDCQGSKVHIYVSEKKYSADFLDDEHMSTFNNYIGTLNI